MSSVPPYGQQGFPPPSSPMPQPQGMGKKKKFALFGCLGLIALFFGCAIIGGLISKLDPNSNRTASSPSSPSSTANANSSTSQSSPPARPEIDGTPVFKTGENLNVGYMQYKVYDSWYTNQLSGNQFLNQPPDATYLFVDLGVANTDKEERTVPPFKLIDENKAEYGTSDKAWAAEGSIGLIQNLNPSVGKRAYVIFDVPTGRNYKLKVSGGYWSSENALIELSPISKKKR